MKVTIVIPNYNGKHFMEPCLSSLSEQTYKNFHILVVDNASSDGSIEYMEENLKLIVKLAYFYNSDKDCCVLPVLL